MAVQETRDPSDRVFLLVRIERHAFRGVSPVRRDVAGFGQHQGGAGGRELSEMHEMPITDDTVHGGKLRHRCDHNPVRQTDAAQRQRGEEVRCHD
jgi:hypothetical protein